MSKYTLANLEDSRFVDIVVAMGRLTLAGIHCRLADAPGNNKCIQLCNGPDVVAFCFRDGASHKVKSELVLDYMEMFERLKSEASCPYATQEFPAKA